MALRTASRLVKLCRAEVGYHEKASDSNLYDKTANSGDKNYTKYAKENYDAGMYNGNKQGFAYCDVFVDNMFLHLCDMDPVEAEKRIFQTGDLGAGCLFSAQYYKDAGRFSFKPFVGDQVFFRDFNHTGVVTAVSDYEITVVEGNTNNQVEENKYSRVDPDIDGYGHPKFDPEPAPEPIPVPSKKPEVVAREVIRGDWGVGKDRYDRLTAAGYDYDEIQRLVNTILNLDQLAQSVIRGNYGVGEDREKQLKKAGYDYDMVQTRVNELLA